MKSLLLLLLLDLLAFSYSSPDPDTHLHVHLAPEVEQGSYFLFASFFLTCFF